LPAESTLRYSICFKRWISFAERRKFWRHSWRSIKNLKLCSEQNFCNFVNCYFFKFFVIKNLVVNPDTIQQKALIRTYNLDSQHKSKSPGPIPTSFCVYCDHFERQCTECVVDGTLAEQIRCRAAWRRCWRSTTRACSSTSRPGAHTGAAGLTGRWFLLGKMDREQASQLCFRSGSGFMWVGGSGS
jgi:hypothetical protein